ncbi:MAG: response regulator, partial [Longimicrobiales bacterium]
MSRRILIVEDDDGHRQTLARHLSRSGWEVATAENGDRALGMFAAVAPHLVLTDIRMPGMSGLELLVRLRERSVTS